MNAIEIARKLAALDQTKDTCDAYYLVIQQAQAPAEELEAAAYILQNGGNYKIPYTCFCSLYNRGHFQEDILSIIDGAFYLPNVRRIRARYEKNCKLLAKYPYLFRNDFLPFEKLPIRFYPFDDTGYIPFDVEGKRFGDYINFKDPVISRNFFKDLEKPILADDVYSQYELEYLADNVRKSEYVGRENHVYLHYTDWDMFCACLQCLNMRPLLEEKKLVFLIGDEREQYPIDFKDRFGIDYSTYPVKPIGICEINRIIWHTQLATHNGGDFFNEVFDAHPNLLSETSVMFSDAKKTVDDIQKVLGECKSVNEAVKRFYGWEPRVICELYLLKDRTDKDVFVAQYLNNTILRGKAYGAWLDEGARIAPAIFFQPHFPNILYNIYVGEKGETVLESAEYDAIRKSRIITGFKYIKTFTPLRRVTTSYGGTIRFMYNRAIPRHETLGDVLSQRLLNRSFMIDLQDRLFRDCVLVRFEDAKLNPKATFTALAGFLDIPYTESMAHCSQAGRPMRYGNLSNGFDTSSVYRSYDEYICDNERYFLEYFLRDVYEMYGYDFEKYDGMEIDENRIDELVEGCTTFARYMREIDTARLMYNFEKGISSEDPAAMDKARKDAEKRAELRLKMAQTNQKRNAKVLLRSLQFVNKNRQPLHMMPKLELDPALLENPIYH